jgi:hypothetical protein
LDIKDEGLKLLGVSSLIFQTSKVFRPTSSLANHEIPFNIFREKKTFGRESSRCLRKEVEINF